MQKVESLFRLFTTGKCYFPLSAKDQDFDFYRTVL